MLQKLGHIILAVLLFIGSTGLVINKHYCQDELKSMAVFHKAEACHSKMAATACPMHSSPEHEQDGKESKDCCDDQSELIKLEQEQQFPSPDLDLQLLLPVPAFVPTVTAWSIAVVERHSRDYLRYKPPVLVCDRTLLLQTFLC